MLETLPDDLIGKIVSLLSLKQILNISSTSHRINKSCKLAIKQIKKISLLLHPWNNLPSGTIPSIEQVHSQAYINLLWDRDKYNKDIIKLLKQIWNNISYIDSRHAFSDVIKYLQIDYNKLHNIQLLTLPTNSNHKMDYEFISHLKNLTWISMPFLGHNVWNNLMSNCKNLHGISFEGIEWYFPSDIMALEPAPNLWTLSISVHQHNLATHDIDSMNKILDAAKNLKYLHITNAYSSIEYFSSDVVVKLPSNLIGLNVDCESLFGLRFDLSRCNKLCYVDLELSFLTESLPYTWQHHQVNSILLLSFLELNKYTKYTKRIGIQLDFENGTGYVSEEEKKAAIIQFKAIMDESEVYRNFNSKELQIISTVDDADGLLYDWANKLFSISAENIVVEHDATMILCDILHEFKSNDEMDDSSEILKYIQKCIDFEIDL